MMVVNVVETVDDLWHFQRKVRSLYWRKTKIVAINHEEKKVSRTLHMTKQSHPSANIHMPVESYCKEHGEIEHGT